MRTKRVKRIKLLKGEKMMAFLVVFFGFIVMPTSWVYTKALLSETNIELEKIEQRIVIDREEIKAPIKIAKNA